MNYCQIRKYDVANGPGIRTTVFVTGCSHNCPGCFNQEYMSFTAGEPWTKDQTKLLIEYLSDPMVDGLTILGGEPFENFESLIKILTKVKVQVDKPIWIYSGYSYEEILTHPGRRELLQMCQVLVDGLFIEELKDLRLKFRGSSNQRIIDIEKSLIGGKVILKDL